MPRLLLLLLVLPLLLLAIILGRCSNPSGNNNVPKLAETHHPVATIENIDTTFKAGVVSVSFDVALTPAATSVATVDYRVDRGNVAASNNIESVSSGRVAFAAGESRKTVHLAFISPTAAEFSLSLTASSMGVLIGAEGQRLTPILVTPALAPKPPAPPVSYTVTVAAIPAHLGKVSGGGTYAKGKVASLRATPAAGSEFVDWREGDEIVSSSERFKFKVSRNRTLLANFRPIRPRVTVADVTLSEGNSDSTLLTFMATLSDTADSEVTMDYATRNGTAIGGAACSNDVDFIATSGTLIIRRESKQSSFDVPICGDHDPEDDEGFSVVFTNISANAMPGTRAVTGIISNDDTLPLPESGELASSLEAPSEEQTMESHPDLAYLKLDASGVPLADQSVDYSGTPWSCVLDRTTGLVWEVKSDDDDLHDKDWTYTWYNASQDMNGGHVGTAGKGFCEGTVAAGCDTEKFVAAVNAAGLCGTKGWRLPTQEELQSIAELDRNDPSIDNAIFPNTQPSWYWSSSPVASDANHAWIIGFYYGYDIWGHKSSDFYVRLVSTAR